MAESLVGVSTSIWITMSPWPRPFIDGMPAPALAQLLARLDAGRDADLVLGLVDAGNLDRAAERRDG